MAPEPVESLLARVRAGETGAFEALRRQLEPLVARFVRRLLRDEGTQEEIYFNLARVDPLGRLLPFVYRIARNRCYDDLRRQGRREVLSLEQLSGDPARQHVLTVTGEASVSETVHWALVYERVRAAIDRLPELQRQTMILHFEEGLPYPEVAEAMGTDAGTVRSRVHYARKSLARLLPPDLLAGLPQTRAERPGKDTDD
jgi:RNA polymerase sigma-70 factor, ECF subfamily